MAKIIGIDLGTTNSCVAVMEGDQPKVLINSAGSRITPSVVAFTEKGDRLIGQVAKHQQVTNPKNTVFSIKRFVGRRHNEVAQEEKMVPYEVTGGTDDYVKVKIRGKEYTPEQISSFILADLKKTAEDYLGEKVTQAVITVPAYFNDAQRNARLVPAELRAHVERTKATAEAALTSLNAELRSFDAGLAATVETSRRKIEYQFAKLARKTGTHMMARDQQAARDARALSGLVFPESHLQERLYSIVPFLAKFGPGLIAELYDQVHVECPDHQFVTL